MKEIEILLKILFEKAKTYENLSEWEFIQTILRDKYSNNMYTASQVIGHQDIFTSLSKDKINKLFNRQVLEENTTSINSLIKIGNMLEDSFDDMIRIRLLTYSYITEIKYIHSIIANLLWISIGGRFYQDPFDGEVIRKLLNNKELDQLSLLLNCDINKVTTLNKTERRIKLICFLCDKAKIIPLKSYIESFYDNHLRNSIYHSRYFVSKDGYVGIDDNNIINLSIEELANKINKCIYFYIALFGLLDEYNNNYKGIQTIQGRYSDYDKNNLEDNNKICDIKIVARDEGGIVTTLIISKTNDGESEEDDGFLDCLLNFSKDFVYNPNEDE